MAALGYHRVPIPLSRQYKIHNPDAAYFVTFTVVNWIDVFTRECYRDLFLDSIRFCQQEKKLIVHAYCIMSNHIHMILSTSGDQPLSGIIRDLKKFTSVKIIQAIEQNSQESRREWMLWMFARAGQKNSNNRHYQFWQQHNHPIELFDDKIMEQKLEYIHQNPVSAGIVLSPEEYYYSSAKNYAGLGMEALLEVELIG